MRYAKTIEFHRLLIIYQTLASMMWNAIYVSLPKFFEWILSSKGILSICLFDEVDEVFNSVTTANDGKSISGHGQSQTLMQR